MLTNLYTGNANENTPPQLKYRRTASQLPLKLYIDLDVHAVIAPSGFLEASGNPEWYLDVRIYEVT